MALAAVPAQPRGLAPLARPRLGGGCHVPLRQPPRPGHVPALPGGEQPRHRLGSAVASASLGAFLAARHRRQRCRRLRVRAAAEEREDGLDDPEVAAMMSELRELGSSRGSGARAEAEPAAETPEAPAAEEAEEEGGALDVSKMERSGRVAILGVPNSGKSSLVNALVGAKVSIVSSRPQTTRQRILGLALLAPRPNSPPTTQAVFLDTAGIMHLTGTPDETAGPFRRRVKRLFRTTSLHKAMVTTAWKSIRNVEAIWWVLDAAKCYLYGDYMPEVADIDGFAITQPIKHAWWRHPEMYEELAFLKKIRRLRRPVHVVLNKVDVIRLDNANVERFTALMRERIEKDLGTDSSGTPLLQKLWPTSVLFDPDSLIPLKVWLCENLPRQSPIFPLEAVSDVPARVAASEITREKLFAKLRHEVPYDVTVVNSVWRESDDGTLLLGQKIVVRTVGQMKIIQSLLTDVTEDAEQEIAATVNFGNSVRLHFQVAIDERWQEKERYYKDVQGLLQQTGSLLYPISRTKS